MKQVRITLSYFKQKIVYITHSCAFFSFTSGKVTFCQSVGRSLGWLVVWLFGRCKCTQRRDNPQENSSLCFCRMFPFKLLLVNLCTFFYFTESKYTHLFVSASLVSQATASSYSIFLIFFVHIVAKILHHLNLSPNKFYNF